MHCARYLIQYACNFYFTDTLRHVYMQNEELHVEYVDAGRRQQTAPLDMFHWTCIHRHTIDSHNARRSVSRADWDTCCSHVPWRHTDTPSLPAITTTIAAVGTESD